MGRAVLKGGASGFLGLASLLGDAGVNAAYGVKKAANAVAPSYVDAPDPANYYRGDGPKTGFGSYFPITGGVSRTLDKGLDAAGLAKPETTGERLVSAATEGAASGVGGFLSGKTVQAAGGTGARVGSTLAAEPVAQAAAGTVGAVAGQGAAEVMDTTLGKSLPEWTPAAVGFLAGAGTGAGMSRLNARANGALRDSAPSTERLRREASDAYTARDTVSDFSVTPESTQRLQTGLRDRLLANGYDEQLHPQLGVALDKIADLSMPNRGPVTAEELHRVRRVVDAAAASGNVDVQRLVSRHVKPALNEFLDGLQPQDIASGDVRQARDFQRMGDRAYSRASKSTALESALGLAEDQAATGGSGTNTGNVIRQKVRGLINSEDGQRQFTPAERERLRTDVVRGSALNNALRTAGKTLGTGGQISTGFSTGMGAAAGAFLGGPVGAAVGAAVAPAIGNTARGLSDRMTRRAVERAAADMRRGRPETPMPSMLPMAGTGGARGFLAGGDPEVKPRRGRYR
jgi:hypothetical protein